MANNDEYSGLLRSLPVNHMKSNRQQCRPTMTKTEKREWEGGKKEGGWGEEIEENNDGNIGNFFIARYPPNGA